MKMRHWLAVAIFTVGVAWLSGCGPLLVNREVVVAEDVVLEEDVHIVGNLVVDGTTILNGPVVINDVVEVNNTVTVDEFVVDPTTDDEEDPPLPPPPPPREVLEITSGFELEGTLQAGQEVTLTIPTNGGDGSVSFKFPDMALSFTISIRDGKVVNPSGSDKFTINSQGVITAKYFLGLSGTGELLVWANDDRDDAHFLPITVIP